MFLVNKVLKITKGKLLQEFEHDNVRGISINSRSVKKGDLFIAIKGDRFDGHLFIKQAVKKGAVGVIVTKRVKVPEGVGVISVDNGIIALGDIAKLHRCKFDIPVIAITGSVGKTTTKEMVAAVLSSRFKVLKNVGTENNHIGVPLTLLRLNKQYSAVVLELGTNYPGEIKRLTQISQPTVAILTNIGESHLERLKTVKGVFREKFNLVRMMKKDGIVIFNADDEHLSAISNLRLSHKKVGYSVNKKSRVCVSKILTTKGKSMEFMVGKMTFRVKSIALHDISNVLAAISCGLVFKIGYNDININIQKTKYCSGRQSVKKIGQFHIIDDTYNSNPISAKSAIVSLSLFKTKGHRILVFGDMLELGKRERVFHEEVGKFIVDNNIDFIIAIGDNSKYMCDIINKLGGNKKAYHFNSFDKLNKFLKSNIQPKDVVLVKGSRSMRMEKVVKYISLYCKG